MRGVPASPIRPDFCSAPRDPVQLVILPVSPKIVKEKEPFPLWVILAEIGAFLAIVAVVIAMWIIQHRRMTRLITYAAIQ
jgi:hypothetical protein